MIDYDSNHSKSNDTKIPETKIKLEFHCNQMSTI